LVVKERCENIRYRTYLDYTSLQSSVEAVLGLELDIVWVHVVTSPTDEPRCLKATSLEPHSKVFGKVLQFASAINTLLVPKDFFSSGIFLHYDLNIVYNTSTKEPQTSFSIVDLM